MPKDVLIYTDGGSRGNPGPAASAFVMIDKKNNKIIQEYSEFIGENTNNVAEYTAMIRALEFAKTHNVKTIEAYSDSEVMVKQLNGEYKITKDHLRELNMKIRELIPKFGSVTFSNVRRSDEFVSKADRLVNQCLDSNQGTSIRQLSRGL
jgi:ribonuclease HI